MLAPLAIIPVSVHNSLMYPEAPREWDSGGDDFFFTIRCAKSFDFIILMDYSFFEMAHVSYKQHLFRINSLFSEFIIHDNEYVVWLEIQRFLCEVIYDAH